MELLMTRLKAMYEVMQPTDPNREVLLSTMNRFNDFLRRKGRKEFPLT